MSSPQNSFGLFGYTPSIYQGDPYGTSEKARGDARYKGKQFKVGGYKKGKTPDVYFDPAVASSVYIGAKYTTLFDLDRKYHKEKKQRQIVTAPFKPSTPSQHMEGKGAYFGTFGKFENMKTSDEYDKRPVKKGETREFEPRNFLTSPSKKGHQGLLSCKKNMQGIANEYHYESCPPPSKEKKEHVTPFKPPSPARKGLFTQDCKVTFSDFRYGIQGPRDRKRNSAGEGLKPWFPTSVSKSVRGPLGRIFATINPPPEYLPQGGEGKKANKEEEATKRTWLPASHLLTLLAGIGPAFRPSSCPKSMRSVSIVNMPRNINSAF